MREAFADTFFWTALANPQDTWHAQAKKLCQSLQGARIVTTDEVLVEFGAQLGIRGPKLRLAAARIIRHLIKDPQVRVIPQSRESFLGGLDLYEARPDKLYSLTDCVSMRTMKDRAIDEALTHDRHFMQEGFRALFRS